MFFSGVIFWTPGIRNGNWGYIFWRHSGGRKFGRNFSGDFLQSLTRKFQGHPCPKNLRDFCRDKLGNFTPGILHEILAPLENAYLFQPRRGVWGGFSKKACFFPGGVVLHKILRMGGVPSGWFLGCSGGAIFRRIPPWVFSGHHAGLRKVRFFMELFAWIFEKSGTEGLESSHAGKFEFSRHEFNELTLPTPVRYGAEGGGRGEPKKSMLFSGGHFLTPGVLGLNWEIIFPRTSGGYFLTCHLGLVFRAALGGIFWRCSGGAIFRSHPDPEILQDFTGDFRRVKIGPPWA